MSNLLSIAGLINVQVSISALPAATPNFNSCLILGTSTVIDVVTRFRKYFTLPAVGVDFGTSSPEYLGAQAWFGQSPQPASVLIGRWAQNASAGQLICSPLTPANQLITAWSAITTGTFKVAVNGGAATIVTCNFTGNTTLAQVAATIAAALTTASLAATCTYDAINARFVFTSTTTGPSSTISFLTAAGSGTDISAQLNGQGLPAYVANGIAAESALAAAVLFDNQFGTLFYGLAIPGAVTADHQAVAAFIEGTTNPHYYGVTTQDPNTLLASDTSSVAFLLNQVAGLNHTAVQYSSTSPYAVLSYMGRMLTTNWQANNTAISNMYKQEPGITPENLSTTQAAVLKAKSCNVFAAYTNATSIIQYGTSISGQFTDTVVGADWLKGQIQTNIYNLLFGANKVPQTDPGMHQIFGQIEAACQQGVNNGLLAPGTWTGQGFGQLKTGDFLHKGYYTYQPPVSSQPQDVRASRISVPFQTAAKLAGAVHTASIAVTVNP